MRAVRILGVVLALALVAAACGNDDDDAVVDDPTVTEEADDPVATDDEEPVGPEDPEAAEAEIVDNFETFFDSETDADVAAGLAENFEEIAEVLAEAAEGVGEGHLTVEVVRVVFTSETTAEVTFSLFLDENLLLPNFVGSAVLEDGIWKVSQATNCDLVALQQLSCPGEESPEEVEPDADPDAGEE